MIKTSNLLQATVKLICTLIVVTSLLFFTAVISLLLILNNDNYTDKLVIFGSGVDMILVNTILVMSVLSIYKLVVTLLDLKKLHTLVLEYSESKCVMVAIKIIHKINLNHTYFRKYLNKVE